VQRVQDNLDRPLAAYSAWLAKRMRHDFEPLVSADMTSHVGAESEATPEVHAGSESASGFHAEVELTPEVQVEL
jgi:hypothetical protein